MNTPLIAAVCGVAMVGILNPLYLHIKKGPHSAAAVVVKGICTAVALGMAVCGAVMLPSAVSWWMAAGLLLCLAGDVLIAVSLVPGMAAFLLGHVAYITAFCLAAKPSPWSLPVFAVLFVPVFLLFRPRFPAMGRNKPAFIVYACVLLGMASLAVLLPAGLGPEGLAPAAGAVLFVLSDLILAWRLLAKRTPRSNAACLTLYWLGQFLLALFVFVK